MEESMPNKEEDRERSNGDNDSTDACYCKSLDRPIQIIYITVVKAKR